jgi:hypothetical protein
MINGFRFQKFNKIPPSICQPVFLDRIKLKKAPPCDGTSYTKTNPPQADKLLSQKE